MTRQLAACYDLSCNPPTYDAVSFLALLEHQRLQRGYDEIKLYVKPGPVGGFRKDSLWPRSIPERMEMKEKVLIPLLCNLPSVKTVHVSPLVPVDALALGQRWISLPNIVKALKLGMRPLRCSVDVNLGVPSKLITFTLREAEHWPLRNSRTDEWVRAAHVLARRGFHIIIIRDTHKKDDRLQLSSSNILVSSMASTDLTFRSCLYSKSCLNVGVNNGPMWMAIFMGVPVLMLRPTTNEARGCYDDTFFRKFGLPPGSQLPTSPENQRLVWEEDFHEVIVQHVEEMVS